MDLYGVLGVERGADAKAIRRGYRRAAKAAHPDAGGSVAEFGRLSLALEVLSDPVRRARYDATGEFEAGVADNREAELMNLVAAALEQAVAGIVQGGGDPEAVDLVDRVRGVFAERTRAHATQKAALGPEMARWGRLAGRFERVGEGENWLGQLARGKVEALRLLMARCDTETERSREALEWLKAYRFRAASGQRVPAGLAQFVAMQPRAGMW